jgi:transcriptional regulator with XRE-family HTH domain
MARRHYLRTLREHRRLTQQQLERLSEVRQNTISKLEHKPHARPVFSTVVALARALGVRPEQLRFGPDPDVSPIERRGRRTQATP